MEIFENKMRWNFLLREGTNIYQTAEQKTLCASMKVHISNTVSSSALTAIGIA
jgi:hypothetical protein